MRNPLLRAGADELSYDIRGIVKIAEQLEQLGRKIHWENIGDPIQKHRKIPDWFKEIIQETLKDDISFGYSHSKGLLETRKFLAQRTNSLNGIQITADDITFFNGLGDAIAKIYQYLLPSARVIGPSPAYSTHSSAEAAHANAHPVTYFLDPDNNWYPDLEDLRMKVKYNSSIVGILVINPDNPTGMVYPESVLRKIVSIAKEFNLFLVFDEIYQNLIYNSASTVTLAEIVDDVPALAMKGISKEFPWPGARCGWIEYYNRSLDKDFDRLCTTLDNAKMIEVSSTSLPQRVIPKIMSDTRYEAFLEETRQHVGQRSKELIEHLGTIKGIKFNQTNGAFYNTIIFEKGVLNAKQKLAIKDVRVSSTLETWLDENMALDKRFVYYLLAAKNICVVPISSFCSDLLGFRITFLEEDPIERELIFEGIKSGIIEYLEST